MDNGYDHIKRFYDDIIMARPFCNKTTIGYWSRQIKLITHMPDIDRDRLIALLESFKELASMNSDFSEKRVNIIAKGILHRYDKLSEIIKKFKPYQHFL